MGLTLRKWQIVSWELICRQKQPFWLTNYSSDLMWFCCQWDEHADQLVEVALSPRTRSPIEDIDGMPVCAVVVTPPFTHSEVEMPDEMIAPSEATYPAESAEMRGVESVHSDEGVSAPVNSPLPADAAPADSPSPAAAVPDSTPSSAPEAKRESAPASTLLSAVEADRAPLAAPPAPPVAKPASIAEKPAMPPKKAAAAPPPPKGVDAAKAMLAPQKKKPPTLRKGKIVVSVHRIMNADHG